MQNQVDETPVQMAADSLEELAGMSPTKIDVGVFKRRSLSELQGQTHFGASELAALLNHFLENSGKNRKIDYQTFKDYIGHAFGVADDELLQHLFSAADPQGSGSVSFSQFANALSVIFRGEKKEIWNFWFKMYDSDHDNQLTKEEVEMLLKDVDAKTRIELKTSIELAFRKSRSAPMLSASADDATLPHMSKTAFLKVMEAHRVLPNFFSPHRNQNQQQFSAFRLLSPNAREVLSLLGVEVQCVAGDVLIKEFEASSAFYFIMSGRVDLRRTDCPLGSQGEGTFLGEAALFDDVKQLSESGTVEFTTSATVVTPTARFLKMNIKDFLPLVFHEHPGASEIVQTLGRVMMERFTQTEERLQALLRASGSQSENGMRLSSKDWEAWRKRLSRLWALRYHKLGRPGKLEIAATKQMGSAADLSVAYSPGVAEPCLSIAKNSDMAYEYTARGHLVGVVTNGTAVLGLGDIGPLAAKPVMEGKAVLFKKFADLDAFDIEVECRDPEKLVDLVCALQPTFGGINLEDIKSPECFYVEREAQKRCNIPIFHDDQHGTAIIAGAGLLNAVKLVNKKIDEIRVAVCGVGAAGFTCAKYFVSLGVKKENLLAVDIKGVVYQGREDLVEGNYLCEVAVDTPLRTLREALKGADVFLGLSAGDLLKPDMLLSMNRDPVVFACANPTPEIDYDLAKATRSDVIMATGRSDFPNQINNVCAFPYIFRGALDCQARAVNEEMKLAATQAIARLAEMPVILRSISTIREPNDLAALLAAIPEDDDLGPPQVSLKVMPSFGREYIIPKPFDERLLPEVAGAVVAAAIRTGVARRADIDIEAYKGELRDLSNRMRDHW